MFKQLFVNKQVIVTLLAILFFRPIEAQTSLANPIDPSEVFTSPELLEIVETLPLYFAERGQVSFYDYEEAKWKSYSYPEFPLNQGETASPSFVENPDGSFILKVDYGISCTDDCEDYGEGYVDFTPPQARTIREFWHFDLTTGAFTQFEPVCGNLARALLGQGEWVLNLDDSGYYLCNTETEQRSNPLTELPERYSPALLAASSMSPDSRYLLFNYPYDATIYVYDFQNHQLSLLGSMQLDSALFTLDYPKIEWVDNQNLILENFSSNYGDDHYYLYRANVTHASSLELLYHSNRTIALRLENPVRYVWVGRQFPESSSNLDASVEDCTVHEYDPSNNTINSIYTEGICSYGWTIPDGTGDRLTLRYPGSNGTQQLIRFNPITNLFEEILTANIQSLAGFSPDGRYAVFVIDLGDYNFQIAVLDLQTKALLEPFYQTRYQYTYIQWINNQTFWMNSSSSVHDDAIFRISSNQLLAQFGDFYPPDIVSSPTDDFMLLESDHHTLDIVNIASQEAQTIAQIPDGTVIYGTWDDNGLISITLWHEDYYHERIGRWRLRLNM